MFKKGKIQKGDRKGKYLKAWGLKPHSASLISPLNHRQCLWSLHTCNNETNAFLTEMFSLLGDPSTCFSSLLLGISWALVFCHQLYRKTAAESLIPTRIKSLWHSKPEHDMWFQQPLTPSSAFPFGCEDKVGDQPNNNILDDWEVHVDMKNSEPF